jgi:hypothetical protein
MDELQNKGQVTIHIDGKYGGELAEIRHSKQLQG